jgi:UPF0716 protein FxsA
MDALMPIGRLLFLAFLLIPIAEIYVLIQVGTVIGALLTIALVVFTAVLGSVLIRAQGLATLARVRTAMERGEVPALELMEGMCLLVAGALLLTPGFVTDSIGFSLLVPALRRAMVLTLLERGVLRPAAGPGGEGNSGAANTHRTAASHTESAPNSACAPQSSGKNRPRRGQIIDGEFERKDP